MNEKNRAERKNVWLGLGLIALAMAVFLFIMTSYFSGIENIMQNAAIPENFDNVVVVVIMPMALCILYLFQSGIEGWNEDSKKSKWRIALASISLAIDIVLIVAGIYLAPVMPIIAGNCFTLLLVVELVSFAIAAVICVN